jgi:hypothetical protein
MPSKAPVPRRRDAEPQAGDEFGTWSQRQLLQMDARFSQRLEQAFRSRRESRQTAAGMVLPTSTAARS